MFFLPLISESFHHLLPIFKFTFLVFHFLFSGCQSALIEHTRSLEFSSINMSLGQSRGQTPEIVTTGLFVLIMDILGISELVLQSLLDIPHTIN